jgi:hypothetical protein
LEQTIEVTGNGTVLKIMSFRVNGYKEYGALLIPESNQKMPVRMYIGGFGLDVTTNSINVVLNDTAIEDPFVFAMPALRGQSLSFTVNDVTYTTPLSEGPHCDAFDGATDDALAFLNVIESTEANVDINRIGVRGG